MTIITNKTLENTNLNTYDCLVIPGNLNTENPNLHNLVDNVNAINYIKNFSQQPNKIIAAICLGILVLGKAEIIRGKKTTGNPLVKNHALLAGCNFDPNQNVVIDGNLITAKTVAQTPE